jgi:hypothetical protein
VQLISVAPEPVATAGARLVVVASIGLTPVVSTSGLTATVTASIEYGAGTAAGLAEAITITLAAGTASGDTEALGAVFIVPIFLAPGAAFAANGLAQTVTASLSGGIAAGTAAGAALTVTVTVAGGAGYSSSVPSVLLHFDGSNNSTTFTDSSANALSFSVSGNAKISTAQSKFGGASGLFDGNGDYIQSSYNTAFDILGSAFTIEAWIYPVQSKNDGTRIVSACGGLTAWNTTNGIHWLLQLSKSGGNTVLDLQLNRGTSTPTQLTSTATILLNTWTHIAACVNGTTAYVGVNGSVNSGTISTPSRPSTNPVLVIATIAGESGNSGYAFDGHIDEFRLLKGQAIYTANFTPPTAPF